MPLAHHSPWPIPVPIVARRKDAAAFFDVSRQEFEKWLRAGAPTLPDGRYDLIAIMRWRIATKLATQPTGGIRVLQEEKLRIANAHALLKLAKEQNSVVDREAMKARVLSILHAVRARLEQVPGELATLVPDSLRVQVQHDAKHRVRLILNELAAWRDSEFGSAAN